MRVWAMSMLVVIGLCGAHASARTPSGPPVSAQPSSEASTSAGIVVLQAPSSDAVLIREGTFTMGLSGADIEAARFLCLGEPMAETCADTRFIEEYPDHEVFLSEYWIDRTEVTVGQYRRCVAAGHCLEAPYASGAARFEQPNFPVTMVSWFDATNYCTWAGGRLPTEAEWERAARGIKGRRFPWGNTYNAALTNHGKTLGELMHNRYQWLIADSTNLPDDTDGFLELAPVASFPEGRTPDGIQDLAGNVEEWVSDYFQPQYPEGSLVNPHGPVQGLGRVIRGGGYMHGRHQLRTTARKLDLPTMRAPWRGFRCVRSA